jgi:cyclopropane-fatty-acyl-phospholipid synthase
MIALPRNVSSRRAAGILRRVFDELQTGCAFRLWDGTLVELGHGAPVCTAVVHRPDTFVRLMSNPTPLNFAEAYIEGAIDIEGDLFAGMKVADSMETIQLPLLERLRLYVELWRS